MNTTHPQTYRNVTATAYTVGDHVHALRWTDKGTTLCPGRVVSVGRGYGRRGVAGLVVEFTDGARRSFNAAGVRDYVLKVVAA